MKKLMMIVLIIAVATAAIGCSTTKANVASETPEAIAEYRDDSDISGYAKMPWEILRVTDEGPNSFTGNRYYYDGIVTYLEVHIFDEATGTDESFESWWPDETYKERGLLDPANYSTGVISRIVLSGVGIDEDEEWVFFDWEVDLELFGVAEIEKLIECRDDGLYTRFYFQYLENINGYRLNGVLEAFEIIDLP